MKKEIKVAIITGIFTLVTGIFGTLGLQSINPNQNVITINNMNGEKINITEKMYYDIQMENDTLNKNNDKLQDEYNKLFNIHENLQYEYNKIENSNIMDNTNNLEINNSKNNENVPKVWLSEMDYLTSTGIGWTESKWELTQKDNVGNTYEHGGIYAGHYINGISIFERDDNEASITYFLDKKYSNFKGFISLLYESKDASRNYSILIYGDDKLIYTSPNITGGVLPIPFDIEVKDVLKLKILRIAEGCEEVGIVNAGFY